MQNPAMKQIHRALELHYQRLIPDEQATNRIEALRKKLQNIFRNNLAKEETPLFLRISGSYQRKTATGSIFDLDMIVVFDSEFAINLGPKSLLETTTTSLRANGITAKPMIRAVKVIFNNCYVDIVPGYPSPNYSKDNLLYIPQASPNNPPRWIKTNPLKNEALLKKYNNQYGKKLIPTIRILKAWNKNETTCNFSSFHLESIILDIFRRKNKQYSSYFEAIIEVFGALHDYIDKQIPEPAGVGPMLSVPSDKKTCLKKRVNKAFSSLQTSLNLTNLGDPTKAIEELRNVFGSHLG